MANRFSFPRETALDANGNPLAGARLNLYESGTTKPADSFADDALTVANANPVVADSAGRFGEIFLQALDYKVVLTDAAGVTIWTADPVSGTADATGDKFIPSQQNPPDMTVLVGPGTIWDAAAKSRLVLAAQTSALITAPAANPRNDIVYIDRASGAVGVQTGIEAASPADPAIPDGTLRVARVRLATTTIQITPDLVDDIRELGLLGAGSAVVRNTGVGDGQIPVMDATGYPAADGSRITNTVPASRAPSKTKNNITTPLTQLDILPDTFKADDTNDPITIGATTIDITTTGNGGRLDGDTLTANTYYHIMVGRNTADGLIVAGFKKTIAKPAAWDYFRRIWTIRTDGASNIIKYFQIDDRNILNVPVNIYQQVNPGIAAVLHTVYAPPGLPNILARCSVTLENASGDGGSSHLLVTHPAQANTNPSLTVNTLRSLAAVSGQDVNTVHAEFPVDSNGQLRTKLDRSIAGLSVSVVSHGWVDRRGRDA